MNIYDIEVKKADGRLKTLGAYKGKVLLIVNTATKCGFTKQYEELQPIYETYQDKGLEILDFPSNQFLGQAPGSIEKIQAFCELNYGTTFPLFDKIKVNTKNAHPLYQYLKSHGPEEVILKDGAFIPSGKPKDKITWNFTKFLISREGEILMRFAPKVEPKDIIPHLEKALA